MKETLQFPFNNTQLCVKCFHHDNFVFRREERELEGLVFNIAVNPETGSVLIQLIDGTLLSYKTGKSH